MSAKIPASWHETNLDRFKFTFPCGEFPTPCHFSLGVLFDTRLEFVDLLPPVVELLAHVIHLFRKPPFNILAPLVKFELHLTEGFETGDEVIMENAEVGERLRFGLPALLLQEAKHS